MGNISAEMKTLRKESKRNARKKNTIRDLKCLSHDHQ